MAHCKIFINNRHGKKETGILNSLEIQEALQICILMAQQDVNSKKINDL